MDGCHVGHCKTRVFCFSGECIMNRMRKLPDSVERVTTLHVHDDSEIIWQQLVDQRWGIWTARDLRRRWSTLKSTVKGFETMTHQG